MLTRRNITVCILSVIGAAVPEIAESQQGEMVTVRVRGDETVRSVLEPIEEADLKIQPDNSKEAQELAKRVPPGRAVPVILIIAGAIAVIQLLKMIQELYRQTYYGGVLIDARSQPPLVTNDPKIPADMVFVIGSDGKTNQYTGDQFSLDALKLAFTVKP